MLRPTFSCTYKRVVHVFSLFHGKGLGTSAGRPAYRLCTKYSKRHTHTHTQKSVRTSPYHTQSLSFKRWRLKNSTRLTSSLSAGTVPRLVCLGNRKAALHSLGSVPVPSHFFGSRVWLGMRKLPRGCGSGVSNRLCAPATASHQRLQSRDEHPQKRVQSWLSAGFDPLQRLVLVWSESGFTFSPGRICPNEWHFAFLGSVVVNWWNIRATLTLLCINCNSQNTLEFECVK